jgi:DNA-directed RNA polymerase alpha subunit
MDHQLPEGLANPARRALAAAGIETLEDLTKISEAELLELHGMGPKALGVLRESMKDNGLGFASDVDSKQVSLAANQKLPRCVPEKKA